MFGKRSTTISAPPRQPPQPAKPTASGQPPAEPKPPTSRAAANASAPAQAADAQRRHSEEYYDVKTTVFNALIDTIDLTQLAKLDAAAAREEIRDIVSEIIQIKNVVMSIAEQEELLEDICNDVLGYGPLEPLLARDEISDIMVNGANTTFIEVSGKVQKTGVRFADNLQLMNICQRIVSQVGRRVDESSPICDARLPDGSRVNVIAPPLAIDGPVLTIRKFKKDRLNLAAVGHAGHDRALHQISARDYRAGALQYSDLRRHGLGQDDLAQLSHRLHRPRRTDHHLRGLRRAAAAAAACGAPRDASAEPGGRRRDQDARPRQELSSYATGAHYRRRGARPGSFRSSAGHEHGPRRLHGHASLQQPARGHKPSGIDDHDGWLPASRAHHPRDDYRLDRRHRTGGAPTRRLAQGDARHRGAGHGR